MSVPKDKLGLAEPFLSVPLFYAVTLLSLPFTVKIVSLINILDDGCLTVSTLGILAFALELKAVVDFGRI